MGILIECQRSKTSLKNLTMISITHMGLRSGRQQHLQTKVVVVQVGCRMNLRPWISPIHVIGQVASAEWLSASHLFWIGRSILFCPSRLPFKICTGRTNRSLQNLISCMHMTGQLTSVELYKQDLRTTGINVLVQMD